MARSTASTKKSAEASTADADAKYTDPELRRAIQADIKAGDKGGRPGQWSARKAQMVAAEYKRRGGGYHGPRDAAQEKIRHWSG